MSEQLENFIRNHKKEFDVFEPSEELWAKLDQQLDEHCKQQIHKGKLKWIYHVGKVAATIIMVLSVGFIWGSYQKKEATKIENINPAYASKEVQFSSMIDAKKSELKSLKMVDPKLYQTFLLEQKKLDEEYDSLKQQLIYTPNQDRIVKAMIRNLQAQISLLNQQIIITQEVKQIKSNQDEKAI